MNVNQLNEQLDSVVTERVRVLARSINYKEAYGIRGITDTKEMIE
jgi:hypothetical protein